jgi:hypothetical protein
VRGQVVNEEDFVLSGGESVHSVGCFRVFVFYYNDLNSVGF